MQDGTVLPARPSEFENTEDFSSLVVFSSVTHSTTNHHDKKWSLLHRISMLSTVKWVKSSWHCHVCVLFGTSLWTEQLTFCLIVGAKAASTERYDFGAWKVNYSHWMLIHVFIHSKALLIPLLSTVDAVNNEMKNGHFRELIGENNKVVAANLGKVSKYSQMIRLLNAFLIFLPYSLDSSCKPSWALPVACWPRSWKTFANS